MKKPGFPGLLHFSTSRLILSAGTREPQQGHAATVPFASSRLMAAYNVVGVIPASFAAA